MRSLFSLLAWGWISLAAGLAQAEPVVDYLDPPSVGRGKKNRVVLSGQAIDRAKDVWTTLPAGKLKAKPLAGDAKRAEFELEVAGDCPIGLYGLRLLTEDGLSNLHLFVVEDQAPVALKDPHGEFPVSTAGVFRPEGVDRYRIVVKQGDRLSFDVVASRLGTDADPLLTLLDAEGRKLAERDNEPGLFFDCAFEHTFAAAGTYTLEVRDSRFLGSPAWRYLLRVGTFPVPSAVLPSTVRPGESAAIRLASSIGGTPNEIPAWEVPRDQPLGTFYQAVKRPGDTSATWFPLLASSAASLVEAEPNDAPEQATPVAAGSVSSGSSLLLCGVFQTPGDKDYFALDLKKGQRLTLRGETRAIHSGADLEMILHDPTGKEIARVDDAPIPGGGSEEGTLNVSAGADGIYRLLVRDMSRSGGPGYGYRIDVQPAGPRIHLNAEVSAAAVPQGSYQIVPLAVTRTDYTGPLLLSLLGAPPGVKLEPAFIPEGENSVVCKLSATTAAPQGLHTLGIAAAGLAGETPIATRVAFRPLVDRETMNIDLIRTALRDNQRWLPASVTSRLALAVTPPIPFGVELPEGVVVLPRYLEAACPMAVARSDGFDGEITFQAAGGQVGEESQGRRQVFVRYPVAKPGQASVALTFHSRSQANESKDRIDVTCTARHGSRRIELKRAFTLAVKPAFEIAIEPAGLLTLTPGGAAKLKIVVQRLPEFQGPVTVTTNTPAGLNLPEEIKIAAGQPSAELELAIPADFKPNRVGIRFGSFGQVAEYQEEPRNVDYVLDVKAPPPPPKEPPKK